MLTTSQLASRFAIARTTILYYERQGLLFPASRSANGYRWYGDREIKQLETIKSYRSFGIPVAELKQLINHQHKGTLEEALERQFTSIEQQIAGLRQQQSAILSLLGKPQLLDTDMLTKQRWTEIMQSAGMSDEDMAHWHRQFEKMEPDAHQEFLESLNIEPDEITEIRGHFQS